jgi:hypothetical protein
MARLSIKEFESSFTFKLAPVCAPLARLSIKEFESSFTFKLSSPSSHQGARSNQGV